MSSVISTPHGGFVNWSGSAIEGIDRAAVAPTAHRTGSKETSPATDIGRGRGIPRALHAAYSGLYEHYKLFGLQGIPLAIRGRLGFGRSERALKSAGIEFPFSVRLGTSDVATCRQVFVRTQYQLDEVNPPAIIVDAGANIGLSSIYFVNRCPNARIFAIEPEEGNFRLLKKNVAPYPRIVPIRAALWGAAGTLQIVDPSLGHWGYQTRNSVDGNTPVIGSVAAVTIPDLMRSYDFAHIDMLKMDIEGAEEEVLANCSTWIDDVGVLIVELHEDVSINPRASYRSISQHFDREWRQGESYCLASHRGLRLPSLDQPVALTPPR